MATLTFKAGASWFTPNVTTVKRNAITAIDIVDSYVITGNEIDSWDASEDNDGSIMCYVTGTILTIAGNGSGPIKFNADQSYWLYSTDGKDYFKNCTSFTGLSLIDTSNCTTLNRSFRGLEKITALDIGHFDISNVTSLYQTFCYCKKVTSLPIENWDVSNVTTMAYTFYQTGASTLPIENWNVSNVTNLDHTFAHSTSLNNIDLTKWDVSNVTNMNATFCGMRALTSLDLSTWDTSKVTCFPQFVEGCSNLETIYGLENFDTSKSVCFAQMFRGCSKLKELDLSSFDTRNADSGSITSDNGSTSACTWQMITNTHKLEKITLGKYFTFEGKGVDIVPAEDISTLPTPSATYIEEADGNWYTEDFTAYAPADVPNLTEVTYYASTKIVNDVIDARVLNYKGLKYVLQSLNAVIDESLDNIDLSGLETKEDASAKLDEAKEYVDTQIAAIPTPDVSGQIDTHNINTSAHSDIRSSIDTLAEDINNKLKDKADYSHSHDNVYYTETEVDDKLLVFDDRIVATDDGELTNVLPDMFGGHTPDEYMLKAEMPEVEKSDWSVNDENDAAYIKNRTHWTDDDGTVHKIDEKYLPDVGVRSWNDLTDKPFYSEEVVFAEWSDGIEGLKQVGEYVRVSETPITPDDAAKYTIKIFDSTHGINQEIQMEDLMDGATLYCDGLFVSCYDEISDSMSAKVGLSVGLWVFSNTMPYFSGVKGVCSKTIPSDCLPSATEFERGAVNNSDIINTVYQFEGFHISDTTTYAEILSLCVMGTSTPFNIVSYNNVWYFTYMATNWGFNSKYYMHLYGIDYVNSTLKTIAITFDSDADDATPVSIEVTP